MIVIFGRMQASFAEDYSKVGCFPEFSMLLLGHERARAGPGCCGPVGFRPKENRCTVEVRGSRAIDPRAILRDDVAMSARSLPHASATSNAIIESLSITSAGP